MDFTREPIIETVITPKEGCKLVVRSSKGTGQEEYFVDAVEVVSFGHSFFFRSLERPKMFFVPATDYEILEVREARMVLKNVGFDRTIKIAGGREAQMRHTREPTVQKEPPLSIPEEGVAALPEAGEEKAQEARTDKKRDRRRNYRRRRGREGGVDEDQENLEKQSPDKVELSETVKSDIEEESPLAQQVATTSILTSLLPPPPTLISETIARYKDNILFKDAFYSKEEAKALPKQEEEEKKEPDFSSEEQFEEGQNSHEHFDEEESDERLPLHEEDSPFRPETTSEEDV